MRRSTPPSLLPSAPQSHSPRAPPLGSGAGLRAQLGGGPQLLLAPVPSSQMWAAHSRPPPLGSGAGYPRAPVRGAAAYLDFCAFPASASGCGVRPCCSVLSLSELFPRMGGSRQSRAIPPYALQEQEQKLDSRCYFFDVRRLPIERRCVFSSFLRALGRPRRRGWIHLGILGKSAPQE